MAAKQKKRAPIDSIRVLNEVRKSKGLQPAEVNRSVKITREVVRQVAVEVWKKYPQALTDPNYQLGEFTLAFVEQEIRQRLDDLRRGVVVKRAALKEYFN